MSKKILRVIGEICGLDESQIVLDRPLIDYGMDSARSITLLVELEREFNVEIADDVAISLRTTQDILDYLARELDEAA